jgi:Hemerythrin HHE cation binding domain
MGLLTRLVGRATPSGDRASHPTAPQRKTESRIAFDPDLIAALHDGHRQMGRHLDELVLVTDAHDYQAIPGKLDEFRAALLAHMRVQNAHLYAYLHQRLAPYQENPTFVARMREAMESVAGIAQRFAERYIDEPITEHNEPAFRANLAVLEDMLAGRKQVEESQLYTLYLPP